METLERENSYLLCYNDLHAIMLDMVTDKNRELLVEISERLQHQMDIRKATSYLPNKEILKG
jgi:hypothetical protein